MVRTSVLGYPRMGPARELKKALEKYWETFGDEQPLRAVAARIRADHWNTLTAAGIDFIPAGDFSLYDHVLDTAVMLGAVRGGVELPAYFSMARGSTGGGGLHALEMKKWFDTNYHYIVPEIDPAREFTPASVQPLDHALEARGLGIETRPVLLGPVTFLSLSKTSEGDRAPLSLLDRLLPIYEELLRRLAAAGFDWIQIDEPALVLDSNPGLMPSFQSAYRRLSLASGCRIMLTTYFAELGSNLEPALGLPVSGLHVDLVRGPGQLERIIRHGPEGLVISAGLVDGRNIWRSDLDRAVASAERLTDALGGERVIVASSCSLLHCPEDLDLESGMDAGLKGWLSFARQKLDEITLIARAVNAGRAAVSAELRNNAEILSARAKSPRVTLPDVQRRIASISPAMLRRKSAYGARAETQGGSLALPLFPTTTIGSFPQTKKVRVMRAGFRDKTLSGEEYERFLEEEIKSAIRLQEEIGLDMLVHGEFERTDMVEHFAGMLKGFAFTEHGWVQSYGSRCVKPPVIFGDVERPAAMTVRWSAYAQSLTKKPVKGMLTGPVTMLEWSFVRDDQARELTCRQIALALRDEVRDLEAAGIRAIQIDEPALREGLPLRKAERAAYLGWAVDSFRLASGGARDRTQIHTHMCYSEFGEILDSIAAMDADVISLESARSRMELLGEFGGFGYPGAIGPGVYDIHSPRIPSTGEILELLEKALKVLRPEKLWVNPDCGLKTRAWKETRPALASMVDAARALRARHGPAR
jgi:5-methyltetrahydropteroyltriglutamate--homocysteine methyltransferase